MSSLSGRQVLRIRQNFSLVEAAPSSGPSRSAIFFQMLRWRRIRATQTVARFSTSPVLSKIKEKGPPQQQQQKEPEKKEKKWITGMRRRTPHFFSPMPKTDHELTNQPSTARYDLFSPDLLNNTAPANIVTFPTGPTDIITLHGLPKNLETEYQLLSKPTTVIRECTINTLRLLDECGSGQRTDNRHVLTGPLGSGKSIVLLQAAQYCHQQGWIVVYIPRGIDLINSTTDYTYDAATRIFKQPRAAQSILQKLGSSYADKLQKITPSLREQSEPTLPDTGPSTPEASDAAAPGEKTEVVKQEPYRRRFTDQHWKDCLQALVQSGANDLSASSDALMVVLEALGEQTQFPVLFAIDDFQALYLTSNYRDPRFVRIKAAHLSVPRFFLEFAGGLKPLKRGALLGALSYMDPYFQPPLVLHESLGVPHHTFVSPYSKRDPDLKNHYSSGLKAINLPEQMSMPEAASIFDLWAADHALHAPTSDKTFLGAYTHASGNPREFVWKALLRGMETY